MSAMPTTARAIATTMTEKDDVRALMSDGLSVVSYDQMWWAMSKRVERVVPVSKSKRVRRRSLKYESQ